MKQTTAIVQARVGSTRLPRKVYEEIAGVPMLEMVLGRLSRAESVHQIVVATTDLPEDDELAKYASELGTVVRGDSADVLSRYVKASQEVDADIVVRVTADCPFIDAGLVDEVVEALTAHSADYATNTIEPRTFPRGLDVEAMRAQVLLEAHELDTDPRTREHVTPFIRGSGRYRICAVSNPDDLSAIRWTVDTPEDLELARLMAKHFEGRLDMSWRELLDAWWVHPEWRAINAHIEQKKLRPSDP